MEYYEKKTDISKVSSDVIKTAKFVTSETNKAAKFVYKKTNKLLKIAKLKYDISLVSSKIEKHYALIGKRLMDECIQENNIPEQFTKDFESITELKNELKSLNARMKAIKGVKETKVCPACSQTIAKSDVFCKKCGAMVD